ncbi:MULTISPECIES: hypothetical protein [unclassified Streptomyces]|uniref:hypothetical protein n=1 Tax=unclassified Streptomyces TaxID=2593676 RepID=UPI0022B654B6|nr:MULTISPECIES: hypothetical protein [unclassified Streptomyces]MCZ7415067.1 hypothetical protein [Streptomyces sp. WMMC897]MCZ7432010.1 hypothetical protein [Streptomyces sp. WMMC1477]
MRHLIAHAFVACLHALLRFTLPASGRRRRGDEGPPTWACEPLGEWQGAGEPPPITLTHRSPYAAESSAQDVVEGEPNPVRWYVVIAESAAWLDQVKAQRRNALLLALDGIDVGPDVIHGVRLPMAAAG